MARTRTGKAPNLPCVVYAVYGVLDQLLVEQLPTHVMDEKRHVFSFSQPHWGSSGRFGLLHVAIATTMHNQCKPKHVHRSHMGAHQGPKSASAICANGLKERDDKVLHSSKGRGFLPQA